MHIILIVLGMVAFVIGGLVFSSAQSSVHEILGGVVILIGAQFFVGGAITNSVVILKNTIERSFPRT